MPLSTTHKPTSSRTSQRSYYERHLAQTSASLKESDKHWVEELDSVLWALRTQPYYRIHTFLHGVWRRGRIALRYYSRLTSSAYVRRERGRVGSAGQPRHPGGGARRCQSQFNILSTAGSKISKQRSTGQDLQCWRTRSTLAGEKKDKLESKWEGPFIIDEVLTGGAYRLRDASDNRLEPNPWNTARLRRFYA